MATKTAEKPIKDGHLANIDDVADYIIVKMNEASWLNVLKLQKLLYYVQAWMLAFENQRLFNGRFQAWVHGPVNREVYDRFKDNKSMYSRVRANEVRDGFKILDLPRDVRRHVNTVLETYGDLADEQLEEMTHQERPWIDARADCSPRERCETNISETLMRDYYKARLAE